MNTCDQCLFWDTMKSETDLPSSKYGHRLCLNTLVNGNNDYNRVVSPESLVSYDSIGTGPKFGCIHFIKKE